MEDNSAERIPQTDRKSSLLKSQYQEFVQIGDNVDLFSKNGDLPVPYVDKTPTPKKDTGTSQRILSDWRHIEYTPTVDVYRLLSIGSFVVTHSVNILRFVVPIGLGLGGLYVIFLGIYMIVTWTYFVHTFVTILVLAFMILTIPQTISNSRRTRTTGHTETGHSDINIVNNVKTTGGRINIINNVNQD